MRAFSEAVLILVGMIVGVGMFAIPFSFAEAGFWWGTSLLIVLTGVVLGMHLFYGEVVLGTSAMHRLPGYVRLYCGRWWGSVAWLSALVGISGTLLVYLIVGGEFLRTLWSAWSPVPPTGYFTLAVAALGAFITFFPLRKEALWNGFLTLLLLGLIGWLIVELSPRVDVSTFSFFHRDNFFLPFGVLLFALSGGTVIPDMASRLGGRRGHLRAAILWGTVIPAILYFLFAFAVVGSSRGLVTEEAIRGLKWVVGERAVILGGVIGFLAVITSFIVLLKSFAELLRLDYGVSRRSAWVLSWGIPLAGYVIGFISFISVIEIVGVFSFGVDAILITTMYRRMKRARHESFGISGALARVVAAVVIGGALVKLYLLFFT